MNNELIKRILSSVILLPFVLFFIIEGSFLFLFFLLVCFLATSYEWYIMSRKKKYHILGYPFFLFSFFSAFALRKNFGSENESLVIFLFILSICISTDIGGYLFGKILKGPKITKLSPNKTYSGMIGGFFFSFLVIYLLVENSQLLFHISSKWTTELFIYILLISTVSQIGDITISYFKRLSKIKDTGKIIPGHGGILDRIDGIIFAYPFTYIMFKFNIMVY